MFHLPVFLVVVFWHVKKIAHEYKLSRCFGAKSIVEINYCNAAFTSSSSAYVELTRIKYICYYESKTCCITTMSTVNILHV